MLHGSILSQYWVKMKKMQASEYVIRVQAGWCQEGVRQVDDRL